MAAARFMRKSNLMLSFARDTRVRRATPAVLRNEVVDHVLAELPPHVHDVVREAEGRAHAAGVLDVVDRAAALVVRRNLAVIG